MLRDIILTSPRPFDGRYLSFSLVYYWCGGEDEDGNPYIYDVLDWREPGTAIGVAAGAFAGLCLVFAALYGLYRLRVWAWKRWIRRRPREAGGGREGKENPVFALSDAATFG